MTLYPFLNFTNPLLCSQTHADGHQLIRGSTGFRDQKRLKHPHRRVGSGGRVHTTTLYCLALAIFVSKLVCIISAPMLGLLSSDSIPCDQGDAIGEVSKLKLLSIGHSKNVYLGQFHPSQSTNAHASPPVPVVLKEYKVSALSTSRKTGQSSHEGGNAGGPHPSKDNLERLWDLAPRLKKAFDIYATDGSLLREQVSSFLHHDAHGNLITAWAEERLDAEINDIFLLYDVNKNNSMEALEIARWLYDRLQQQDQEGGSDGLTIFNRACEQQLLSRYARQNSEYARTFPFFYGRCTKSTYLEERVDTIFTMSEPDKKKLLLSDLVGLVLRASHLERESRLTFLTDLNEHNFGFRKHSSKEKFDPVILDASYCLEDRGETFRLPQFCDAVHRMFPRLSSLSDGNVSEQDCVMWNLKSMFSASFGNLTASGDGRSEL